MSTPDHAPARWKLELALTLPGLWLSLSTPDAGVTNPDLRPRLWPPSWLLIDHAAEGALVESSYLLLITWFFHLALAWGRPCVPREQESVA